MTGLAARVVVERATHRLDVDVAAEPGEVVAVVGPNGSGKTTLLEAVVGLVPLTRGEVRCDGRVWEDARTRLPVAERRVGVVFQDRRLFPHLDARDNAAYGLRVRGVPRRAARDRAQEWLDRLGVGDLAGRRPSALSGGQAQRVAIARALACEPVLLLLDEPMAALDVGVAMGLRLELAAHLSAYGGATLLVTHDAVDALTLADRVVVLDDGRVAQVGAPADVARQPRTAHVARLVGRNVARGRSAGTLVELDGGASLVTASSHDGPVHVTFSPAAVALATTEPAGSARNRWPGRVVSVAPHGEAVRVHVAVAGLPEGLLADVTAESAGRLSLGPGREVWASLKATEIAVQAAGAAHAGGGR